MTKGHDTMVKFLDASQVSPLLYSKLLQFSSFDYENLTVL